MPPIVARYWVKCRITAINRLRFNRAPSLRLVCSVGSAADDSQGAGARRIAELLFNEPATRRGAAPTRRAARDSGRVLCGPSVKDHSGYSPSSRRAPSQNSQQRCYSSLRIGALTMNRLTKPEDCAPIVRAPPGKPQSVYISP
jgi:hypothetical protein